MGLFMAWIWWFGFLWHFLCFYKRNFIYVFIKNILSFIILQSTKLNFTTKTVVLFHFVEHIF
ncbi:hypothetical protein [Moraxella lacunata]|uniref:hypothetical protein n=1 Tax=Moraxella lacunata TaxID=477 RepID=UPI003EE0AC0E